MRKRMYPLGFSVDVKEEQVIRTYLMSRFSKYRNMSTMLRELVLIGIKEDSDDIKMNGMTVEEYLEQMD